MKHATPIALEQLERLLAQLRLLPMKEKTRGVFYVKSRAFLHFHEDKAGLFADIRAPDDINFDRFKVDEKSGADALLAAARDRLVVK